MGRRTEAADRTVKDIRRQIRKRYSSEEKIRIVLTGQQCEGLRRFGFHHCHLSVMFPGWAQSLSCWRTLIMIMRQAVIIVLAAVAICGQAAAQNHHDMVVDLELILAVDVSRSMNTRRLALQRQGYVAAFRDRRVSQAIQSGPQGRIAVTYVEWSGADHQHVVLPWRVISNHDEAVAFSKDLEGRTTTRTRRTSISAMLQRASVMFQTSGFDGLRRVIDVSGDGPNNSGSVVEAARDELLEDGVVINGLPIISDPADLPGYYDLADLDLYYRDCVIGGLGSFYIPVTGMQNFAKAIRMKLILEIADLSPPRHQYKVLHRANYVPSPNARKKANCLAGQYAVSPSIPPARQ